MLGLECFFSYLYWYDEVCIFNNPMNCPSSPASPKSKCIYEFINEALFWQTVWWVSAKAENRGPAHLMQNMNNNKGGSKGELKGNNSAPNLPL